MKRILLGTSLLLLAGLCGQPAHADGNYTSTVQGVNPQSGSYNITWHSDGQYASIPISVAQQSVQITGATPSRTSYVGWNMSIKLTVYSPDGTPRAGTYLAQDYSNGVIPVTTDANGTFIERLNNQGSYSQPYQTNVPANWTVDAGSSITDAGGTNKVILIEGRFTTVMLYYS